MNDVTLESYLRRLGASLGDCGPEERAEILSDIRAHVEEACEGAQERATALQEVLAKLGHPAALAESYRAAGLLEAAASRASSPATIIRAVTRWALMGVEGTLALFVLLIGFVSGFAFWAAAACKPFMPDRVGFYWDPPLFTLGHLDTGHKELLGYWIIPVGILVGTLLFIISIRFTRWMIRRRRWASALGLPGQDTRRA
jgi:hypothetical protein